MLENKTTPPEELSQGSSQQVSAGLRHPVLPLALLVILALGLRLCNIGATSLWIDEIYSFMVANVHPVPETLHPVIRPARDFYVQFLAWQPMNIDTLIELLKINVHMPLYYLLINPWLGVFGNDAVGLRSFSALFSTLCLLPVYALGVAFGGKRTGLLAAFAAAVIPFQIYFGQEGRMYALTLFWACCSALAFWKTLHSKKPLRWGLLHAATTALGMLSHYLFAFYILFQAAYAMIWLVKTRDFKRMACFGFTLLGLLGVAIGWAPIYRIQQQGINDEYHFAKGLTDWSRYATSLVWQPLVTVAGDNTKERVFYLPFTVLLLAFYFLGSNLGRFFKPDSREHPPAMKTDGFTFQREGFLLAWVFVPLLAQIGYDLLKQTHTVVVDRYVMLISPAMVLLVALALSRIFETGRKRLALGLLAGMLALGIANVWNPSPFRDEHNKKDLNKKFAYMLHNVRPDDLVFVNGPMGAPGLAAYYLNKTRPGQPMIYWINTYRGQQVPLPEKALFSPYRRVWLFRNRANNERGLQTAKEHIRAMFPRLLETEEKNDWWLLSR
ncbi:MAG TPA: glycosyltransferase family 39 protein [Coleofasciculaceae cyanobacterium]